MSGMEVTREIAAARAAVAAARRSGQRIGFVPTMGALHAGHLSLVEAAKHDATYVVVSIFVNPTQFGPQEDFARYPRDEAGDLRKCEQAGADLVFIPTVAEMYPPAGGATTVHVARLTDTLCGPARPGHFDGVATVVGKLFNIVQPDRAYFGQKDAQQLAVIRRMTRDLDWPVEVVACPTVREPDGLALSSRNGYLSADERQRALALYRALCAARDRIQGGERDVQAVTAAMRRVLAEAEPAQIDYAAVVDPDTVQLVTRVEGPVLIAVAVRIGATRLIDNVLVDPGAGSA
jgi:pantoate--beta-alanine ligase